MLRHINLTHFRSWQSLDIELAPITVLFGANNSGKSNILSALLLLRQTASHPEPINFGGGDLDYVDFGSYQDLVFANDASSEVGIYLNWDNAKTSGGYAVYADADNQDIAFMPSYDVSWRNFEDVVEIERIRYEYNPNHRYYWEVKKNRRDSGSAYEFSSHTDDPFGLPQRSDETIRVRSCFIIEPGYVLPVATQMCISAMANFLNDLHYLGPLREEPQRTYLYRDIAPRSIGKRGADTIAALIYADRQKTRNGHADEPSLLEQVREWLIRMDVLNDFQLDPLSDGRTYRVNAKTSDGAGGGSLADVGFGVSQVLPVLTLLFFAEPGSIILLEQPELHLHPSAQSHLADLMLDVAEKRNLQLIVESHSEHLLRRLQRRIAESAYPFATPDNIRAYFCSATENGSQIEQVEVNPYGQVVNWPDSFFGDISSDIDAALRAGLEKRRQELANG
jgi:predicted ATPase